jgi:hypothetical protein
VDRSRSTRIASESLAIVFSILLAFWIDAWWDQRGANRDAGARLNAFAEELAQTETALNEHFRVLDTQVQLAATVLGEVSSYSGRASRMDSLLFQLGPFPEAPFPTAALEDMLAAGGLGLISSSDLRRLLSEYRALLEMDLDEQRRARDHFEQEMAPFWTGYVNDVDHLRAGPLPTELGIDFPRPPFESRYEQLLAEPRFSNQIVERVIMVWRVRGSHELILQTVDELSGLLTSHLP